jgi:hypothetical protein
MLSVASKTAIARSFAPEATKAVNFRRDPIDEALCGPADTSYLSDVQALCLQFDSDPSVIASIESALATLYDTPCQLFANLTFTHRLMEFVTTLPEDIDEPAPILISALHVLARITVKCLVSMRQLALSIPDFYPALVSLCQSGSEPVVLYSLWIIANMLTTSASSGFFVLIHTRLFDMFDQLLLWQNDNRIVTLLALILKRLTSQFATPERSDRYLDLLAQVLATGAERACQVGLRALSKFVRIAHMLQRANSHGLLRDCIAFLGQEPFVEAALSLYARVLGLDEPEIAVQLGRDGIIEALYQPLASECERVQLGAMAILMGVLVSDQAFVKAVLDSGIVEQLCARATDGTYSVRARAVHAICEICYCDHSVDVWERIVLAGGLDAICEFLTVGKAKTSAHTILALSHIVKVAPGLIGADMAQMILDELVKIAEDPANQENHALLFAARGLYLDITDEEMKAEIGDIG